MEHIISANELIKSSLIPSLIINSSGEITLINESASLLFGYASNELIGENIDAGEVKRLCAEIKEKYNFVVSILSLGRDQFEQMKGMELFPKVKKSLYRR